MLYCFLCERAVLCCVNVVKKSEKERNLLWFDCIFLILNGRILIHWSKHNRQILYCILWGDCDSETAIMRKGLVKYLGFYRKDTICFVNFAGDNFELLVIKNISKCCLTLSIRLSFIHASSFIKIISYFVVLFNDISLARYDIRSCRMIYLLRKHDIISVPSYAKRISSAKQIS